MDKCILSNALDMYIYKIYIDFIVYIEVMILSIETNN